MSEEAIDYSIDQSKLDIVMDYAGKSTSRQSSPINLQTHRIKFPNSTHRKKMRRIMRKREEANKLYGSSTNIGSRNLDTQRKSTSNAGRYFRYPANPINVPF